MSKKETTTPENVKFQIKDGVIEMEIDTIKINAVPFRGRNGIYFSFRSRDLVTISKMILVQNSISIKNLMSDYERRHNDNDAQTNSDTLTENSQAQ